MTEPISRDSIPFRAGFNGRSYSTDEIHLRATLARGHLHLRSRENRSIKRLVVFLDESESVRHLTGDSGLNDFRDRILDWSGRHRLRTRMVPFANEKWETLFRTESKNDLAVVLSDFFFSVPERREWTGLLARMPVVVLRLCHPEPTHREGTLLTEPESKEKRRWKQDEFLRAREKFENRLSVFLKNLHVRKVFPNRGQGAEWTLLSLLTGVPVCK